MVLPLLLDSSSPREGHRARFPVFACALGTVGAVRLPTRQSFLVEMVGPDDLPGAIALNASIFNTARVIGPALAGVLVATVGEAPCFFLNSASYLAVLWAFAGMRLDERRRPIARHTNRALRAGALVLQEPVQAALLLVLGLVPHGTES